MWVGQFRNNCFCAAPTLWGWRVLWQSSWPTPPASDSSSRMTETTSWTGSWITGLCTEVHGHHSFLSVLQIDSSRKFTWGPGELCPTFMEIEVIMLYYTMGFGIQMTAFEVSKTLLTSCFWNPAFTYEKWGKNGMYYSRLLWRLVKLIHLRCLILYLGISYWHNKCLLLFFLLLSLNHGWFLLTHSISCGKSQIPKFQTTSSKHMLLSIQWMCQQCQK